MNWTIASNGTEKSLADWGLTQVTRRRVSQGQDDLTFKADGAPADAAPIFPFHSNIVLWRDRTQNGDGTFSDGTIWFAGLVIQVPRTGAPDAESMAYKAAGPWWYLDNIVFLQAYQNIFLGFGPSGDPTFGPGASTHVFLNQGLSGTNLVKVTTGVQILEALNWALKPFTDAGVTPPFQIGEVTPNLDAPIDEVRDITCAEVIHKMLRWSPDAVTWFDYSTTPPTFNCKRRSELEAVNLEVTDGDLIRSFNINARNDLQAPSVQIFYETAGNINGQENLSLVKDFFPNPLPTDPAKQFAALQFTVNLQGIVASATQAKIVCDPISPNDPIWWLGKHPQYQAFDKTDPSDANNPIASFTIDATSLQRVPNPDIDSRGNAVTDKGFTNELTTGQLTDWMTFQSQRITLSINAKVVYRDGTIPKTIPLTYQCLSTNATTGTYTNQQVSTAAEPVPVGLAEAIYDAISVLQFEGEINLQEEEVSDSLSVGNVFNLLGGANAEWGSMNSLVQGITENIDEGTTAVSFGPPRNLSAGELVDLLRVNRARFISSSYTMRPSGTPSNASGQVDLGNNTPEKNSVSGTNSANPHVVSETVDGTGPIIKNESDAFVGDCSTKWYGVAGPSSPDGIAGSVTIALSDCAGADLKISQLKLCLNGVPGTMYFLCSNFVPDP